MATKLALGADVCNSARAMMFALGCIQALRCNTNQCPTGVATQDPELVRGLHVGDKATRVARFHRETVKSFLKCSAPQGCASARAQALVHHEARELGRSTELSRHLSADRGRSAADLVD